MKIIILNQKGGVGKSTITVNLGYGLSQADKKTLIIDLDPQAHSSVIYSPELPQKETIGEIFRDRGFNGIKNLIRPATVIKGDNEEEAEIKNLSIIPSNIHLATTNELIFSRVHREKILHDHLQQIEKDFDFVLIDCPPTLGPLTANAIFTADIILIPTNYGKYSLNGISDLFESIEAVKETTEYRYMILRSMKDVHSKRTNEAIENALNDFKVLETVINRSEAVNQALMQDLPVYIYAQKSKSVNDFNSLTKEILSYV